jgi:hypothetical protein
MRQWAATYLLLFWLMLLGGYAYAQSDPIQDTALNKKACDSLTKLEAEVCLGRNQDAAPSTPPPDHGSPGHIFWVVPAFNVEYLKHVKPLTPREKFNEWARGAYDPLGLAAKATQAALEHSGSVGFCGYGEEWGGYGKCYGSGLIDGDISSVLGDYLFPTLIHQDPRYFRWGEGGTAPRLVYALSRVFIRQTDSGHPSLDSALLGTAIAAATSNVYYPPQERGFGLTMSRIEWDLSGTAFFNLAAEFWPDIQRIIRRPFRKHNDPTDSQSREIVFGRRSIPEPVD